MSDNDFVINPNTIRSRSNASGRKPLPPGQTRHRYEDEPETHTDFDDSEDAVKGTDVDDMFNEQSARNESRAAERGKKSSAKSQQNRRQSKVRQQERVTADDEEETPRMVRFLLSRRVSIWLGLVLLVTGVAIFINLLSFLKNGASDQALIMNLSPEQIRSSGAILNSDVGPLGAALGQFLFAETFGIGAFVIVVYLLIVGWKLLFGKQFNFWGLTFRCALLAVTLSIVLGLVTYSIASNIFWGGIHGHYANKWLLEMTGVPGALAVSALLISTVIAVYFNELRSGYYKWKETIAHRRELRLIRQEKTRIRRAQAGEGVTEETPATDENTISDNLPDEETDPTTDAAHQEKPASDIAFVIDTPANNALTDQEDSTIVATAPIERTTTAETTKPQQSNESTEPGFEIDVPVTQSGKKSGSVAERLVAEHGEYDPRADLSRFKFPTLDMLADRPIKMTADMEEQQSNKDRIIKTLGNYGITISSIKATVGPTVTLYEIVPTEGTRIAKIKQLEDDIALSLSAKGIRIIAPMPGKGTVGIEVPNAEPQTVSMRTLLASKKFRESKGALPIALGATISNDIFVTDLAAMPHALVAGATGQGKSVGLNVLITSLLYRKHPAELKFVLIDPKMVEFSVYERLKGHYLATLPGEEDAVVTDSSKVLTVLNSLCTEMDNRYNLLRQASVNKIEDYNRKFCQRRLSMEKGHRYMPYIVVIIDEFADLIMTGGKEIETPVMRITQKARAVGIHMIIATQRPSTNVLTGIIKANCPSRIAFRTLQNVDSRTILDRPGAERLIGRGDMLYSQGGDMERMQCAFVTTDEIESICDFIEAQVGYETPYELPEPTTDGTGAPLSIGSLPGGGLDRDPLFGEAARFIVLSSTASTSSLQRRFEIGYNRAGKLMDQMEAAGIVGPASGAKPRSVLMDPQTLERILANR